MLHDERLAIIGLGRMGTALSRLWAPFLRLYVFDRDPDVTNWMAAEVNAVPCAILEDAARAERVVLALPDEAVIDCVKEFSQKPYPVTLINIATNLDQRRFEEVAAPHICCCSVKFVGHAAEMALGMRPVAVVSARPADKVAELKKLFGLIAEVTSSDRDIVKEINTLAAQEGLRAGVNIETGLQQLGYTDDRLIRSAIELVGAGTLRSFATGNLGPFARKIVEQIKSQKSPS